MRWNTFARSAVLAAVAGGGLPPYLLLVGPLLSGRGALAFYLVAVTAVYVAAIATSLRRGLGAAVLVGVPGLVLAALAPAPPQLAVALGMLLALARSGFLYRARPARALAAEVLLIAGGLGFARFLAGTSLLSLLLAIWGFLLVQSMFFLIGGVRERDTRTPCQDPFDAAYERATTLLDGLAV